MSDAVVWRQCVDGAGLRRDRTALAPELRASQIHWPHACAAPHRIRAPALGTGGVLRGIAIVAPVVRATAKEVPADLKSWLEAAL
ncbi:hypothetical protein C8N30_0950 [Sulfitobacter guttiformis]|uniref:Uncharacterized protein n=1 Tax=Sulfitobacter guttiformis TaxID=74349 RepID=A0A420DQ92_9RHOB|nr:hypothetical protein C8N30_0950 [Sulfitobacter guttiformis]